MTNITCWTAKTMLPGHGRVSGAGIESHCKLRFPCRAASPGLPMNRLLLASAASLCLTATGALADEGMWTFDNFPVASVNQEYGLHIDQAWLDRLRGAAGRLSIGCSASVVTADGLVLTNHHCVRDCAQELSNASKDYVKDGFQVAKREDEKLCAGMQAEILSAISDATDRVTKAAAGKTGQDFIRARDAEIAAVEKEGCAGKEDKFRF